MKEITILSGKGGTGKTSITAAFASVSNKTVLCDNDVDASDLHLILHPVILEENIFYSKYIATIDTGICTNCGICISLCNFDAIDLFYEKYVINPFKCEGCKLCERACPQHAVSTHLSDNNFWYKSNTRFGPMVHAKMGPGEENSGKLVSLIRTRAKQIASDLQSDILLNDGPPGVGCTAISSITGTNHVIIVTEPTKSGLHDASRIVELADSFNVPISVIINKYDMNLDVCNDVEDFFKSKGIEIVCKLPFDEKLVESMVEGKSIIEYAPEAEISQLLAKAWNKITLNSNTL